MTPEALSAMLPPIGQKLMAELDAEFEYVPDRDRVLRKTYRAPGWTDDPAVLAHRAEFIEVRPDLRDDLLKPGAFRSWKRNIPIEVDGRVVGAGDVWLALRDEKEAAALDLTKFDTVQERAASDRFWASPEASRMTTELLDGMKRSAKYRPRGVGAVMGERPPAWLVRNVLPVGGLAILYAESGAGKTFLAIDLAIAVARGEHWLDERTTAGVVVYVGLEGRVQPRLEAAMLHQSLDADDLEKLLILERAPINLVDRDPKRVQDMVRGIEYELADLCAGRVSLVIIDTLARAMPGGNENDGEDMGIVMAHVNALSRAFGCLVLLVHHSGKDQARGARGHSSLKAAADAELEVTRDGPNRFLKITKLRDGEDGRSFAFNLLSVDLGPTSRHDPDAEEDERDTSLVVVHGGRVDQAPKKSKGRALGVHPTNALTALRSAFAAQPVSASPFTDGGAYVSESAWRAEFDKLYPVGPDFNADERKREIDRRRGAFRDSRSTLVAKRHVSIEEVDGEARIRFGDVVV